MGRARSARERRARGARCTVDAPPGALGVSSFEFVPVPHSTHTSGRCGARIRLSCAGLGWSFYEYSHAFSDR